MKILLVLYHLVAGALSRASSPPSQSTCAIWVKDHPVRAVLLAFLIGFTAATLFGCAP